jgi:ribulose-5-phosphate 4-epimerase/fuculose-1-phosphate aldolase
MDMKAVLHDLVLANHILARKEIVDGYGHVSVRDPANPQQFFLSRSIAPPLVTDHDIMTLDLNSDPVGGDSRAAYLERFIHGEIYRVRPDVKAVVHCHTPEVLPFADTEVPMRGMFHMSGFISPGVPVYEIRNFRHRTDHSMLVHDRPLGAALARVLSDKNVALMRGHGAVIVGPSLAEAVARSVYLKINATQQVIAMLLSKKVNYMRPEEGSSQTQYAREWDLWTREAEANIRR